MVLIYDRMPDDPRIRRLGDEAHLVWVAAIGACNRLGRDTIAVEELDEALDPRRAGGNEYDVPVIVDELVRAELAERLPGEHLRLLARLDLWAFDDDDVVW